MGRIEGFLETEKVLEYVQELERHPAPKTVCYEENTAIKETYTIYLLREGRLQSVQIQYENLTSVKAPRITAIKLLLSAKVYGYTNPFPESCELELVNFNGPVGRVVITMKRAEEAGSDISLMQSSLIHTLRGFGVDDIVLELHYN